MCSTASLGALGMCSSTRGGELKTPCHVSESQTFITWMLQINDLSKEGTQHGASASLLGQAAAWEREQCSPEMPTGPMHGLLEVPDLKVQLC